MLKPKVLQGYFITTVIPTCAVMKKTNTTLSTTLTIFLHGIKTICSLKNVQLSSGSDLSPLVQGLFFPPLWLCDVAEGVFVVLVRVQKRRTLNTAQLSCWHHDDKQEGMLERSPRLLDEGEGCILWSDRIKDVPRTQQRVQLTQDWILRGNVFILFSWINHHKLYLCIQLIAQETAVFVIYTFIITIYIIGSFCCSPRC